ncbi:1,4-dihydroxy-2-naphthoate polyprenyltransferase [Flammeovirgaceae bacterium SG7u.111]|nr:1,4-dihydroxy-2-naphthoate polyprenyltransferase [Flammeovirgaceae bacterium SG7u.132]WPO36761.1 1,4-dihydroxy-2-naphthoate polyprenyltransferase [Flammeovirgaceae bacterium SG7u.111]
MMKIWLEAIRLRTLPLALASIGMGSFLAAAQHGFRWEVLALCALTTIFLQILSNLANDYGDSIHGADSKDREGPSRAVQSGKISPKTMKTAMILLGILSLVSGISLLYISISPFTWQVFAFFFVMGLMAIAAAITYTAGSKPYGYAGLGDISVLIFFGWIGVLGTFYLHTGFAQWKLLLPATSCGLLATAVLNVNNIRDIQSDTKAGKMSIPVRLGRERARIYHWSLLIGGMVCAVIFLLFDGTGPLGFIFLITLPLLFKNGLAVSKLEKPAELDPYLKQMAMTTLLFVISFGIGILL